MPGRRGALLPRSYAIDVAPEPDSLIVTTDDGTRTHYLDWGRVAAGRSALPPLLLVHGLLATAWSWAPVARRLAEKTHVLALDLRGHGLSDSPRTGYDLESLAFDALTVLVANGYGMDAGGPPAVIAGHGLGAMVGASAGTVQPGSVAGLALVDAGWEEMAAATGLDATEFQGTIGDPPEVLASMDAYLADRREFDPASWDAEQERASRAAVDEKHAGHVAPVVRAHALRGTVEAMFEFRPHGALAGLDVPLLIVVAESGSADDETVRERRIALDELVAARTAAGRQPPEVRVFRGAGHNLMRYRAAELSDALHGLLDAAGGAGR